MVLNARDRDEFVFFVRDATKNMIAAKGSAASVNLGPSTTPSLRFGARHT